MSEQFSNSVMGKLHTEIAPLLVELYSEGLRDNEHPSVKQLFDWFVDQHRTGEEFHYVLGPLREYVLRSREENLGQTVEEYDYLGNVAIAALAVICPILEGSWELVAWLLMTKNTYVLCEYKGADSDYITTWIIQMMGNADFCPNPCLRFKLIIFLLNIDNLNDHNWTKAFESVLFASSFIDIDYLLEPSDVLHNRLRNFYHISKTLELFAREGYLFEFDGKLAKQLLDMKTVRLCAIFRDVTHNFALNPNRCAQPLALNGLTALLKLATGLIQVYYKKWRGMRIPLDSLWNLNDMNEGERKSWIYLLSDITEITNMLRLFICNFNKSCQTPQLVDLTASCVMEAMELVIPFYASSPVALNTNYKVFKYNSLININQLLGDIFYEKDVLHKPNSPVAKEIKHRYRENLSLLREFQTNQGFLRFSNIMDLILD